MDPKETRYAPPCPSWSCAFVGGAPLAVGSAVADIHNAVLQDTFEDAVETGSPRSLTKRQQPVDPPPAEEQTGADREEGEEAFQSPAVNGDVDSQEATAKTKTPQRLSRDSAGSFDNVNLDDAAATTAESQQGMLS